MYRAVKDFKDLQDNKHFYCAGDTFPRAGLKVSDERILELSTNKNASKMVLIEKVEEVEEKPVNLAEKKREKGHKKNARTGIESN